MARRKARERAPLFLALVLALGAFGFGCNSAPEPEGRARIPLQEESRRAEPERPSQAAEQARPTTQARPAPPPRPDAIPAPPDVSAPPADAERTASGLASKVLRPGTGDRHPTATDVVRVHYTGWRAEDGQMFDSSVTRGQPATFPLNRVIRGWTEGVQLMVEGEKRRFWIPANLAYEGNPRGPQGMLVFDVELLEIQ